MGRFDIIKGEQEKKEEPKVQGPFQTFGFEEISIGKGISKPKPSPVFRPEVNERHRVGIVFKDPKNPFIKAQVHWHNRYFLCKSQKRNHALCCTRGTSPSTERFACVIAVYAEGCSNPPKDTDIFLFPLVFGKMGLNKLCDLNSNYALTQNDFILIGIENRYLRWDIQALNQGSLWQSNEEIKNNVLSRAEFLFTSLPSYLGEDLTIPQIRELYTEILRTYEAISRRPIRTRQNSDPNLDNLLETL